MQLLDARRLTGPNHLSRAPLVIVELALEASEQITRVLDAYSSELARMRAALGFSEDVPLKLRVHRQGAVIGYEAPIDVMLACAEVSEWAALSACEVLAGREALDLEPKRGEIDQILARDSSPRLLALLAEAERRGLPFLWDDEQISVGAGSRSACWPRSSLPEVAEVPWAYLGAIPVALVTGTNGKTTSTRLLARIAREAGIRVGSASSDEIAVGSEVLGQWRLDRARRRAHRAPPHGRRPRGARDGARGHPPARPRRATTCDAALITNVGDDHLGSYGIDDISGMAHVKAVVTEAVRPTGTVVLNAHDAKLVALAPRLRAKVVFFADLDRDHPAAHAVVAGQRARGESCVFAQGGRILAAAGEDVQVVVDIAAVPITFGGAAAYNVENVAACVAMARALGIGHDAIVRGLCGFQTSDNPRRGELVERLGVRVLLDFGHNPGGIRGVMQLSLALREGRPGRLIVVAGAAGDRSEHDISEVARTILAAKPDRVLLRDLSGYLRGRAPGEVPAMFERALSAQGFSSSAVETVESEVAALRSVFDAPSPGDFVVVLVHLEPDAVHAFLDSLRGAARVGGC